ncbi:uncharacterized protein N7482_000499 [Penicillium canariense]|uniref:Uncharacterized protein n=1 Tax=Penicillium canariense TaxID=189055 RepID=A0A9W9IDV7_9EURO|nr:uncharacterized protein N7482_000499 [Penicillium canariense]KAJ5174622.1 hypothetical protein N7482_000499 [Penicillium canariense]
MSIYREKECFAFFKQADGVMATATPGAPGKLIPINIVHTVRIFHGNPLLRALSATKEIQEVSFKTLVTVSQEQNENIVAYNNAIMDCYHQILQRRMFQKQVTEASSQLMKENRGLPSILGFCQRFRD